VSLRVDALGTCRPGIDVTTADVATDSAAAAGTSFDMLDCRYVSSAASADGVAP